MTAAGGLWGAEVAAIVIVVACVCMIAFVVLMIAAVAIAIAKSHAGCNVGERHTWVAAKCTQKSGNE